LAAAYSAITPARPHEDVPATQAERRKATAPLLNPHRSYTMNWERIEGNWKQLKGKVKEQWGKLTDDDFDVVAGKRDQLTGKVQERYGLAKDEAERQVRDWERRADDTWIDKNYRQ
jgi:uncharacterized protein YjbJ (UPF0337 family)